MELTQIETSFKIAVEDLTQINGRIFVLNSFVTQTKLRIENDERVGNQLISAALPIRDITVDKNTTNLFLSSDHYNLDRNNLNSEVDMILSRECLFQISQAYEILETFLYDSVTELIRLNNNLHLFVDNKVNESTFSSIRKALKSLNDRKNNRHLIGILRANCPVFTKHITDNIYDIDFEEWYEMLSEVRHCITHNRTEITNEMQNAMPVYYKLYFKNVDYVKSKVVFVDFQKCSELLSKIADFIFFVFKSITEKSLDVIVDFKTIQHIIPDIYFK